jgi:hypothetical protein
LQDEINEYSSENNNSWLFGDVLLHI